MASGRTSPPTRTASAPGRLIPRAPARPRPRPANLAARPVAPPPGGPVVIVSALAPLTFFRSRCDWQGPRLRWLSRENYWVSIIHTQFIVSIRLVLMPLDLSTLTKFVRSAAVVIPLCYVVPWSLRRIPIVDRVL